MCGHLEAACLATEGATSHTDRMWTVAAHITAGNLHITAGNTPAKVDQQIAAQASAHTPKPASSAPLMPNPQASKPPATQTVGQLGKGPPEPAKPPPTFQKSVSGIVPEARRFSWDVSSIGSRRGSHAPASGRRPSFAPTLSKKSTDVSSSNPNGNISAGNQRRNGRICHNTAAN